MKCMYIPKGLKRELVRFGVLPVLQYFPFPHGLIYSLLIEKDLCECQNVSVKFLCALLVFCAFHPETS
jgi:hypothetical protein